MLTVAFVVHERSADASRLAERAASWLAAEGHRAVVVPAGTGGRGTQLAGADLVVSLGGDGTMLRAVGLLQGAAIPVLGVNLGHLGYLTAVEAAGLEEALRRFIDGDRRVQERMTLEVGLRRAQPAGADQLPAGAGPLGAVIALNEALVEKQACGHTVQLALRIGGRPFITYTADGVIVATPTGSTAYNLSSRGPIVSPSLRAMIVTPVSPHMLFDRSLVLGPDEEVVIELAEGRPATLVVDGSAIWDLQAGDSVTCRSGPQPAYLLRPNQPDFHDILRAKFGLPDRS